MSKINRKPFPFGYPAGVFSFLLPVVLLSLAFFATGLHPFGNNSTLLVDGKLQYVSFFSEYVRQIKSLELPLFSKHFGLGINFFGTWAYYLSSPVNLLLIFFPGKKILDGIFVVLLVKSGLCGSAFFLYARKTLGSEASTALLFSTSYALCGFFVYYADNIQWMDGLIWLPILVMGIEEIRAKGHCTYYPFAVAVLIISNYYISVMSGVFCVLYTLYVMIRESRKDFSGRKRTFLAKIALHSILGIGMAAFILIPVFLQLRSNMDLLPGDYPSSLFDTNAALAFGGLFWGRQDSMHFGSPKIFSGVLAAAALPLFFLSQKIKIREKLAAALFMIFVYICFHVSWLTYIWEGMDKVGGYFFRFSFVLTFLILSFAAKGMDTFFPVLNHKKLSDLFYCEMTLLCVCISYFLCGYYVSGNLLTILILCINAGLIIFYTLWLCSIKQNKALLVVILCAELVSNAAFLIRGMDAELSYADYDSWTASYTAVEETIEENDLQENGRTVIALDTISANDPLLFGVGGIDYYSSAGNMNLSYTLKNLGYTSNICPGFNISDNSGSLLMDSLLGISSIITDRDVLPGGGMSGTVYPALLYQNSMEISNLHVDSNPLALSAAYMVDRSILSFSAENSSSGFAADDSLLSAMLGKETDTYEELSSESEYVNFEPETLENGRILCKVPDKSQESSYTVTVIGQGAGVSLYLDLECYGITEQGDVVGTDVTVFSPQKNLPSDKKYIQYPAVLSLGSFPLGTQVKVQVKSMGSCLYILHCRTISQKSEDIKNALSPLYDNEAELSWTSSRSVQIEMDAVKDGILFVSIPYDTGWSAKVNGKSTKVLCAAESFIGIPLQKGKNIIKMSFFPVGLHIGLITSGACLAAVVFLNIVWKKKRGIHPSDFQGRSKKRKEKC